MSMPRQSIVKVDLSSKLQRIERGALLATADKLANRMGAEVYQNGTAASLTGYTVKGYFIRAGVDTITIAGTIDGNKAYIDLPESCYLYDGSFSCAVKLCKSGYEQTLVIFDGYIVQTITDKIIDSGNVIPFMETVLKRNSYNLLDNSNFAMPVNQRGDTSYSSNGYTIDRWKITNSTTQVDVNDGYITVKALSGGIGYFRQQFEKPITTGVFTLAICVRGTGQGRMYFTTANGSSGTGSVTFNASSDWQVICLTSDATSGTGVPDQFTIRADDANGFDIKWAALYAGEYTAETLSPYMPKGYAHELLECQRHFHLYATEAARPKHGLDCVPHMRLDNPTQGTIDIDGTTYYYNSAEL